MDRHCAMNRGKDVRAGRKRFGTARNDGSQARIEKRAHEPHGKTLARRLQALASFATALLLLVVIGLLGSPQQAHALPAETISGTCYVECTDPNHFDDAGRTWFHVRFPQYGIETLGVCISGPMYGIPLPGHYPFTGVRMADGGYRITVDCSGAEQYPDHSSSLGPQNVGDFKIYLQGDVELRKHGDAAYEQAVPNATVAGAVYELVDSSGDRLATLVTDKNGYAAARGVPLGTHTLREVSPSNGYALDGGPQAVTVRAGTTAQAVSHERPLVGAVSVTKTSAFPVISNNNPCYSLAGARFGVFRDAACTDQACQITTDEQGEGTSPETLWPGTYWIKETAAPTGYALNNRTLQVTLDPQSCRAGQAVRASVTDMPQLVPVDTVLRKVDLETESAQSQGDATLAGAQFEIAHYAGAFSTAGEAQDSGIKPTFVTRVVTNDHGEARLDNAVLASNGAGQGLALGTLVVRETKPPQGYLLAVPNTFVIAVTADGTEPLAPLLHTATVAEQAVRGDLSVVKFGAGEGTTGESSVKQPLVGVAFDIVHQASGRKVARIVTDERGYATTADVRANDQAGALPYGTYQVREDPATTPAGYKAAPPFTAVVAENGATVPFLVENATGTVVRVVKQDAETGQRVSGITRFRILNEQGQPVSFQVPYPSAQTVSEFRTDETGSCTLPGKLNGGGTYYVQEIEPPHGYVLNSEPVSFTLAENGAAGSSMDDPLVIAMKDFPQTGRLVVQKTDADTGTSLALAQTTWDVRAAEDIITADGTTRMRAGDSTEILSTDERGIAQTNTLYPGTYELTETQAPHGYTRPQEPLRVEILYGDPTVATTQTAVDAPNRAVTGVVDLTKTDKASGTALQGAVYEVRAAADIRAADGAILIAQGRIAATLTTDDDGHARSIPLPLGVYDVLETRAPQGYKLDETPYRVELAYQDQDTECVTAQLAVADEAVAEQPAIAQTKDASPARTISFIVCASALAAAASAGLIRTHRRAERFQHLR